MTTTAVSSSDLYIPLIDFAQYLHGSPTDRAQAAQDLTSGFRRAGFVYLRNHGIPPSTVSNVFAHSAAFFARSQAEKDKLAWTTPAANRGYVAHGREKVSQLEDKQDVEALRALAPDLKESMEIGREGEEGHPNNWPEWDEQGREFKRVMTGFHEECKRLHMEVMRAMALGLGIEEGWFDEYTDGGDNTLRLLHYPGVERSVFQKNKAQVRAGEHTDYGSITLLFQDDRGGLQVQSPNGTFVDATPIKDTIVINAGDLLARWSNDAIKSTKHRVVEPPFPKDTDVYPARYSIAYFCNPNFEKFIDAIPGTYEKEGKKYPGVNSGDYLVQRLTATY